MGLRENTKPWFETGDYPTQAQFWQFFDSIFFKDELIPQESIAGLIAVLLTKADKEVVDDLIERVGRTVLVEESDFIYVLPANYLLQTVVIIPSVVESIKIGITEGGEEIMYEQQLAAGVPFILNSSVYAIADMNLFFTGLAGSTQIIIYKR